jgi:hypothetical protein
MWKISNATATPVRALPLAALDQKEHQLPHVLILVSHAHLVHSFRNLRRLPHYWSCDGLFKFGRNVPQVHKYSLSVWDSQMAEVAQQGSLQHRRVVEWERAIR